MSLLYEFRVNSEDFLLRKTVAFDIDDLNAIM